MVKKCDVVQQAWKNFLASLLKLSSLLQPCFGEKGRVDADNGKLLSTFPHDTPHLSKTIFP